MEKITDIYEIRDGLWNLIGGDRWEAHEETFKFVESQPSLKNGRSRMLSNRMTRMGLARYVKADPQEAERFMHSLRSTIKTK
jgi:hypothetical protein